MKEKWAKLIDVKSIVTLIFTFTVAYLAIFKGLEIKDIFLIIISFYFGTQHEKKNVENTDAK